MLSSLHAVLNEDLEGPSRQLQKGDFARGLHANLANDSIRVEPISKLFQEHRHAGELDEPEEVAGVVLPANEEPPLPLKPGTKAFDEPAPFMPA